jgi:hypothetical protein
MWGEVMMRDRETDPNDAPATDPAKREQPPYVPPTISWEEPFEAVVAATCSHLPIQGGPCSVKSEA